MTSRLEQVQTQTRSVSQAEQYLSRCAWAYYLRRIEGVTPRPAAWSIQGRAFHSACEAHERSGRTLTADEASEIYAEEYATETRAALNQEPNTGRWLTSGPAGIEDIEARYVLGRQQTADYVRWAQEHGPNLWKSDEGEPGIELHLTAEIGGVMVQGYIDQVPADGESAVRIRDLKTGSTRSRFQLETYAVLVRKVLGLPVRRGDWWMAKTGKLSRAVDLSKVTEEQVGARYAEMDAGVKAGDFPARPGWGCRYCDVSHACSARR